MSRLVVDVALDRGDFRLSVQGSFDLLGDHRDGSQRRAQFMGSAGSKGY